MSPDAATIRFNQEKTMTALVYNGHVIHDREEMLSLTDMWRAAGEPLHREPFNWARKEGRAFVEAVALQLNLTDSQVFQPQRGRNGGTFAHWQVGLAYAKYLSSKFHMWCNEVVRAHMEGRLPESATRPEGPEQALGNRLRQVELYRQIHGPKAAAWMAEQLGFPRPPAHLVERDVTRRRDPEAERRQLWARQGRNRQGFVRINGQLVDPDEAGWRWDAARSRWTLNGRWLDVTRNGWAR